MSSFSFPRAGCCNSGCRSRARTAGREENRIPMAGRIRQEDLEAVRERSDIVQVISGYLQLKKAGRDSLSGLCPFHTEKTPSFSVSPSKQLFHCHGCGEGGSVFTFLQKLLNLSFPEAVERLAATSGATLRDVSQLQSE